MDLELNGSLVTFVWLRAGARLNLTQNVLNESLGISRLFVWQGENSSLTSWGLRAGNAFLSERMEVYLQGLGASAALRHLTVGADKSQADMAVRVYHQAPQTVSDLTVRTAAAGKHVAVYRGLIDIDERGKGSKGYQSGRALLLNRGAVVDMLPELAIKTNDVQCSHGVTTTHIDEAALFYMRSRGLPVAEARRLAMTGFFHDMLEIPEKLSVQLEEVINSVMSS
jgi:Fe-S cluster assembly protein SufD